MILLDAVNKVITRLGENPVDSVDVRHPTVSLALQHIKWANEELQIPGWWFNTYRALFRPNAEGHIVVSESTQSAVVEGYRARLRGRVLVNAETNSDQWDRDVWIKIREIVPFEETPYDFASWVVDEACIRAYVADFGLEEVVQDWQQRSAEKAQLVQKEHLIQMKHKTNPQRQAWRMRRSIFR